ncbi:hypothetical protein D3C75_998250 [compost metagenome]
MTLNAEHPGVFPVLLQQLSVASRFGDCSALNQHNPVAETGAGQAVGNINRRFVSGQPVEAVIGFTFGYRVQCGCRLIQNQHRRILI